MASDAMKDLASSRDDYADELTIKILYGEIIE